MIEPKIAPSQIYNRIHLDTMTQLPQDQLTLTHAKVKTSEAYISESKAVWTKWQGRRLFTFHILSIHPIFVKIPWIKSDDLSLSALN
jgi:hypothetical protein